MTHKVALFAVLLVLGCASGCDTPPKIPPTPKPYHYTGEKPAAEVITFSDNVLGNNEELYKKWERDLDRLSQTIMDAVRLDNMIEDLPSETPNPMAQPMHE